MSIEQRVDLVSADISRQVELEVWDGFAALFRLDPLSQESVDRRLSDILTMTNGHMNLRGMMAGAERQELDLLSGEWGEKTGLPGIDQADSSTSREANRLYAMLDFDKPKHLSPGVTPHFSGSLGCAGFGVFQRIEASFGYDITQFSPDGKHPINRDRYSERPNSPLGAARHFTLSSSRGLFYHKGEDKDVHTFAPGAQTEFDLELAAGRVILGGEVAEEYRELKDVGFKAAEGERGLVVIQAAGDREIHHIRAPKPADAKRGRAQTAHTYAAMEHALGDMIPEGSNVAFATRSDYAVYQKVAALSLFLDMGWRPHMVGYTSAQSGDPKLAQQPQLLHMPEVHSFASHLHQLYLRLHPNALQAS